MPSFSINHKKKAAKDVEALFEQYKQSPIRYCEQISQIFGLKYWLSVTYCVKVSFFTITSKPNMAIPQNRPQKARNLSPVAPSPVMRDHPGLGPSAHCCTARKRVLEYNTKFREFYTVHCPALKNAIGCNKNILHCTTLDFAQF